MSTNEVVERLWYLHRRALSYASDKPAVNFLLADLGEGLKQAAEALSTRPLQVPTPEADAALLRRIAGQIRTYSNMKDATELERVADALCAQKAAPAAPSEEALRKVLEPFAAMGRVMEARARMTFGKVVPDSEIVCQSSGEAGNGILTMGHFRDAAATLPNAPGWGGMYRPPFDRAALAQKASNQ